MVAMKPEQVSPKAESLPKSSERGGKRPGAGRKRTALSADEVKRLAKLQCTMREAAAFFGIAVSTFKARLDQDQALADAWEHGRQLGLISLRRAQFRAAERGNSALLIHLGKVHLANEGSNAASADEQPLFTPDMLARLSDDDLEHLVRIFDQF